MPPAVTISDYSDGAPLSSWRNRSCPGMTEWFSFSWEAFSLRGAEDRTALIRRVAMWSILGSRLLLDVFDWGAYVYALNIPLVMMQPILSVLSFFFIGWCLAHIGQSEGSRKVLNVPVGRLHFDGFLIVCATCHVGMTLNHLVGFVPWPLIALFRLFWWVMIVGCAWVASWPSDDGITLV